MAAEETERELQRQITLAAAIGADTYPALILEVNGSRWPVGIDYNDPAPMLDTIRFLLEEDE
jgi:hypothetical protein